MEIKAVAKFLRISPTKVRITARHIVGKRVGVATSLLTFSPRKSAHLLLKVVQSALANAADRSQGLDVDSLIVSRVLVDQGPALKRWRPRAQGRAYGIKKRSSHITVVLGEAQDN